MLLEVVKCSFRVVLWWHYIFYICNEFWLLLFFCSLFPAHICAEWYKDAISVENTQLTLPSQQLQRVCGQREKAACHPHRKQKVSEFLPGRWKDSKYELFVLFLYILYEILFWQYLLVSTWIFVFMLFLPVQQCRYLSHSTGYLN